MKVCGPGWPCAPWQLCAHAQWQLHEWGHRTAASFCSPMQPLLCVPGGCWWLGSRVGGVLWVGHVLQAGVQL